MYKPGQTVYATRDLERTFLDEGSPTLMAKAGESLVIKKFWTHTGGWEVVQKDGIEFVVTEEEIRA